MNWASRIGWSWLGAMAACGAAPRERVGVVPPGARAGATEVFAYDVHFTQNQHGVPESTCARPICRELLAAIDGARSSIDFAIYGIRAQPHIVNALVAAQHRGVVVRGVVDADDTECTKFGYPDTAQLMSALSPGSVKCDAGPGFGYIMHNKFFVFDREKVWTGSTNISDTELGGEYNSDVAVMFSSRKLAAIYGGELGEMYGGLFHRRKTDNTEHVIDRGDFDDGMVVKSYFSPTDHARDNAVVPLIAGAAHTLDVAMFYFTSQAITDAVLAAKRRGVSVRMILDATGAASKATKHHLLCAGGIAVKTENWGGKSHSKWAVADAGLPGAAVVFGSMNWTGAGDEQNDENTLYVKNGRFASSFHREFERQWADLARVPVCAKVSAEGADSSVCHPANDCSKSCTSGSCCDGIDNDYDGKIDLQDEACACADGIDNDGDGFVDMDDWDCRRFADPPEPQ